jgi:hypothetical protein
MFSELHDTTTYIAVGTFSDERELDRASTHLEHCAIPLMIQHMHGDDGELSFRLLVSSGSYHAALRVISGMEDARNSAEW